MTKNEIAHALFNKLNLGKAYILDDNGNYIFKKGNKRPFCLLLHDSDNYKHHVLWLANKYLKRKVRTNAEKFNELVDLCVMCDSLIVNNASDSIRDKRLADYKFPTDLKLEIYKYIKEIMVNRNGTEIIPLDEKLVTAL